MENSKQREKDREGLGQDIDPKDPLPATYFLQPGLTS
jgi:hypothetical protein